MTSIPFTDVLLTPAVVDRWQEIARQAAVDMRAAKIQFDPEAEEQLFELTDGRLLVLCQVNPAVSVTMHAERGEWSRVSRN